MRPERLVAVLGTGTEVGKTWVAAHVLTRLRAAGTTVAARKPVQSFAACDVETDAVVLGLASGEPPEVVCAAHRSYAIAMAPPIAAAFLGTEPPTLDQLVTELEWPDPAPQVGIVETVGGPRSPLAADADSAAFAAAIAPDLSVLVARAGLGAINAVRLSAPTAPQPLVVFLNRFDNGDLHERNRRWLHADGYDVVVDLRELVRRIGGREKAAGKPAAR